MKKNYFLILFLFTVGQVQSQTWALPGAIWYYNYHDPWVSGYYTIEYTGDTIIQSHLCNKLAKSQTSYFMQVWGSPVPVGENYVYTDNNVVYCLRSGTFYPLYDFNAQPGDTVYFGWENREIIPGTCDSTGFYIVDSIGSILINGVSVNYQNIRFYDYYYWNGFVNEKIYDRFGGDSYLYFYRYGCDTGLVVDGEIISPICSYYDSLLGYYSGSHAGVCDSITGIQNPLLSQNQISILKNPVKDYIELLNLSKEAILPYSIYDVTGKVLLKGNLASGKNFISVSCIANGLYFFKTNSQKFSFAQKFLKQ